MAEGRRKAMRETVIRLSSAFLSLLTWWLGPSSRLRTGCARGAKKSVRVPDNSRAMVDVNAMVVTCVDDSPAGGGASGG